MGIRRDGNKRSGAAYVDRYSWQVVLCGVGIKLALTAFAIYDIDGLYDFNRL